MLSSFRNGIEISADDIDVFIYSSPTSHRFVTDIGERRIPLAAPRGIASWALLNLILSILGVLISISAWIYSMVRKKRVEYEYDEAVADEMSATLHSGSERLFDSVEEGEEEETVRRNRYVCLGLTSVLAVAACILFILTQDMTWMMVWMDFYTIFHKIIFAGGLVAGYFAFRGKKKDIEEDFSEDDDIDPLTGGIRV